MGVIPSRYPPPVDPAMEFIGAPTDPESERVEVGVAIVGASSAGPACANRLAQLLERELGLAEMLGEVPSRLSRRAGCPAPMSCRGRSCARDEVRRHSQQTARWPQPHACTARIHAHSASAP